MTYPLALNLDSASALAGVMLTAAGLVLTLWLAHRSRKVKTIRYRVSDVPAVEEHEGFELSRNGEAVPNARVVRWTVSFGGTEDIAKDDIARPITLNLGPGATPVGSVKIVHEDPPGAAPEVRLGRNSLILVPDLHLAKDEFTLSAIVANFVGPARVDGRVRGVRRFVDEDQAARQKVRRLWSAAVSAVAVVVIATVAAVVSSDEPHSAVSSSELGITVRAWGLVGTPYRGQYQLALGINAYANSSRQVDIRLERFALLVTSLDTAHWRPPGAKRFEPPRLVFEGRPVWAVPATANGVSVVNPATGRLTIASLWSAHVLDRGESYPSRRPDGVMSFFLPRADVSSGGALRNVMGLAYLTPDGHISIVARPAGWGPQRQPNAV
jgi:hypothetical protein